MLLFLFYYILPRQLNFNLPGDQLATLVFALWVAAEMSDIATRRPNLGATAPTRIREGNWAQYSLSALSLRIDSPSD